MRIQNINKLIIAATLSVVMVACKSTDDMAETDTDTTDQTRPETSSVDRGPQLTPEQLAEQRAEEEALRTTVFYFEFDKSDLSAEAREALVYHARALMNNPGQRVRLEGHADERGTREYNLALGERRAQAVARYLQVQGVSSNQLEIVSYGEERPANPGTTEQAYSENRRVELVR